jgi:hypothetical protein
MSSVNAWYFKAGATAVKLVKYDRSLKTLHKLLECDTVDCQVIHTDTGNYTIWYNDNGLYEDKVFNKPASQVIGKLPIRWGTMNGNFLVTFGKPNPRDDEEDTPADIPAIGFKDWITLCSDVMREAQRRREEMWKDAHVISFP